MLILMSVRQGMLTATHIKRLKQEKHDLEAGLSYTSRHNNNNKAETLTVSALYKLAELEKNVKDDYVHADTLR